MKSTNILNAVMVDVTGRYVELTLLIDRRYIESPPSLHSNVRQRTFVCHCNYASDENENSFKKLQTIPCDNVFFSFIDVLPSVIFSLFTR